MQKQNQNETNMRSACYCINLRRAANAVTKFYDAELKNVGLTLNQFSLLRNLCRLQPASVTELANAVKLERTTITRSIKPLFEMGLIKDSSREGERNRSMCLTKFGQKQMEESLRCWSLAQKKMEEVLGLEELQDLMGKLAALETFS